ncbi:MAG: ABC transporter, partial [Methanoculleus sp.]|nr:ABC transporter [Methanoculleus sp.]
AHPDVLFLAEPTKGLDEPGRREIWNLLRRLNRERRVTIVFTTHDMDEAEAICNRVAVVDGGEVVALDTPDTFRAIMTINDTPLKFDDTA